MKKLVFIVEGDSEAEFVKRIMTPFFASKGIHEIWPIIIGHGYDNIEHFKNTVKRVLSFEGEPVITTFIDYYRINSTKKIPDYDRIKDEPSEQKLAIMEQKLNEVVQSIKLYRFFVPYIQRHEFETLLFADPEKGFNLEDEQIKQDVIKLCKKFDSIEDINDTPQGAPSVRLKEIYALHKRKYKKGADAVDIADLTSIEKMLEKCPHFRKWVETLIEKCQ